MQGIESVAVRFIRTGAKKRHVLSVWVSEVREWDGEVQRRVEVEDFALGVEDERPHGRGRARGVECVDESGAQVAARDDSRLFGVRGFRRFCGVPKHFVE